MNDQVPQSDSQITGYFSESNDSLTCYAPGDTYRASDSALYQSSRQAKTRIVGLCSLSLVLLMYVFPWVSINFSPSAVKGVVSDSQFDDFERQVSNHMGEMKTFKLVKQSGFQTLVGHASLSKELEDELSGVVPVDPFSLADRESMSIRPAYYTVVALVFIFTGIVFYILRHKDAGVFAGLACLMLLLQMCLAFPMKRKYDYGFAVASELDVFSDKASGYMNLIKKLFPLNYGLAYYTSILGTAVPFVMWFGAKEKKKYFNKSL